MNNPGFSGSSNGDILKPLESHALSYSKAHCLLSGVSESVPTYLFVILYDKSFYFFDSHYLCTFFLLVFLRICSSSSMVEYFGSEKSFFISEV